MVIPPLLRSFSASLAWLIRPQVPAGQRFVAVGVEPYAEVSGVLHFRHVRFGNGERYVADRAVGSLSAALDLLRRESDPDRNVRRVRDDQVHVEIQRQGVGHLAVDFDRAAGEQVIDQIRIERFVDRLVGPPVKVGGGSERDLDRVGDPGESVFRIEAGPRVGRAGVRAYRCMDRDMVRGNPEQVVDRTCRERV